MADSESGSRRRAHSQCPPSSVDAGREFRRAGVGWRSYEAELFELLNRLVKSARTERAEQVPARIRQRRDEDGSPLPLEARRGKRESLRRGLAKRLDGF